MSAHLRWRIYYRDGEAFDSSMGSPQDAPPMGVVAIAQADETRGRTAPRQYDFYVYYPEGYWQGADIFGLVSNLLQNIPMVTVKQGVWVSDEAFAAIVHRAQTDPDIPQYSAKKRNESGGKAWMGLDG